MRYTLKLTTCLLLLLLPLSVHCQSVVLTAPAGLHPGSQATITAHISNDLVPRAPIVLTASISYTDWQGAPQQATASPVTLNVTQPLEFKSVTLDLGASATYVVGSASSRSVPVAGTTAGTVLTLAFDSILTEGQTVDLNFGVAVK